MGKRSAPRRSFFSRSSFTAAPDSIPVQFMFKPTHRLRPGDERTNSGVLPIWGSTGFERAGTLVPLLVDRAGFTRADGSQTLRDFLLIPAIGRLVEASAR